MFVVNNKWFNDIDDLIIELIRFRLNDLNILRLIKKLLCAGVQDDGKWLPTTKGSEQGNLASPVIANIYMHYALVLWFDTSFKKQCRGYAGLVVYADDFVTTFQYKWEADKFLKAVEERFEVQSVRAGAGAN